MNQEIIQQPQQSLWSIGVTCTVLFAFISFALKFLFERNISDSDKKIIEIDKHLEFTDSEVEKIKNKHAALELTVTEKLGAMELRLISAINATKK